MFIEIDVNYKSIWVTDNPKLELSGGSETLESVPELKRALMGALEAVLDKPFTNSFTIKISDGLESNVDPEKVYEKMGKSKTLGYLCFDNDLCECFTCTRDEITRFVSEEYGFEEEDIDGVLAINEVGETFTTFNAQWTYTLINL